MWQYIYFAIDMPLNKYHEGMLYCLVKYFLNLSLYFVFGQFEKIDQIQTLKGKIIYSIVFNERHISPSEQKYVYVIGADYILFKLYSA